MGIILYTLNTCSRCQIIKAKMQDKKMQFKEVYDVNLMVEKGIRSVPYLEVDGDLMDFRRGIQWVNAYGNENS